MLVMIVFFVSLLKWTVHIMAYSVFSVSNLGWGVGLLQNWDKVLIAIITFVLLTATEINPFFLVIIAAIFGFVVYR